MGVERRRSGRWVVSPGVSLAVREALEAIGHTVEVQPEAQWGFEEDVWAWVSAGARDEGSAAEALRRDGEPVLIEREAEAVAAGGGLLEVLGAREGRAGVQLVLERLRRWLVEPTSGAWARACAWLERCDAQALGVALAYVREHVGRWPLEDPAWGERMWRGPWTSALGTSWDALVPGLVRWRGGRALGVAPARWRRALEGGAGEPRHAACQALWASGAPEALARLLEREEVRQVRALGLACTQRDRRAWRVMEALERLERLEWLELRGLDWSEPMMRAAMAWEAGPAPSALVLDNCRLTDAGLERLARTSLLRDVRRLALSDVRLFSPSGFEVLALWQSLEALVVSDAEQRWHPEALAGLWSALTVGRLTAIRLDEVDAPSAVRLMGAPCAEGLRRLELCGVREPGWLRAGLRRSRGRLRLVSKLNLSDSAVSPEDIEALGASPLAEGLRWVAFPHIGRSARSNSLTAWRSLLHGPMPETVEWLALGPGRWLRTHATFLAEQRWPKLRVLSWEGSAFRSDTALELADAPGLDALETIIAPYPELTAEAQEALDARGWRVVEPGSVTPVDPPSDDAPL